MVDVKKLHLSKFFVRSKKIAFRTYFYLHKKLYSVCARLDTSQKYIATKQCCRVSLHLKELKTILFLHPDFLAG